MQIGTTMGQHQTLSLTHFLGTQANDFCEMGPTPCPGPRKTNLSRFGPSRTTQKKDINSGMKKSRFATDRVNWESSHLERNNHRDLILDIGLT